jgi:hypothetical protein
LQLFLKKYFYQNVWIIQNDCLSLSYQNQSIMAKALKITKEDIYKMERAARRNAEIELQLPRIKHSVHKTKKDYNRQLSKKVVLEY